MNVTNSDRYVPKGEPFLISPRVDCDSYHERLAVEAEQELAAFVAAVNELFGPYQTQLSSEDWIEELESTNMQICGPRPDWRRLTLAAAARLAGRVCLLQAPPWPSLEQPSTAA